MSIDLEKFTLKSNSFFSMLTHDDGIYARDNLSAKPLSRGEVLYTEGLPAKGVYIVRKGKIKISTANLDGKESILYIHKRGEFFGYRPLVAGENCPVTAAALDAAEVYFLPGHIFLEILDRSHQLAKQLLVNLSSEFSVWSAKITLFSQFAVKQRVALSLLVLIKVYGFENKPRPTVSIGRDDLAAFVGTAKETVVRTLRLFKDEGTISTKGAKITVNNRAELENSLHLMSM